MGNEDMGIPMAELGQKKEIKQKKEDKIHLYILVVCLTVAYAALCHNDSVWADEAYTMLLVQKPWPEAWEMLVHDVHPPLYYVIVKLVCMAVGYTVPVVKGVSVCCVCLLLLLGVWLVYPDFGKKTAVCYILTAGMMPQMFRHGVELRMYAMAAFYVTACGFLALRLWFNRSDGGRRRTWAGFCTAGLAAAYTHYFALISIAWIYVLLLAALILEKRNDIRPSVAIRRWLFCLAASVVLYVPWLFVFAAQAVQVRESYWISLPSVGTMVRWTGWLFKTAYMPVSVLYSVLFVFGFVGLLYYGLSRKQPVLLAGAAGYGVLLLTVLTGVAVTFLVKPVFVPRYMIPAAGLAAFGLAVFAGRLRGRFPVLFCVSALLIGGLGYRDVWKEEYGIRTARTRAMLDQTVQSGDTLVYDYEHLKWVLEYYYPDHVIKSCDAADWNSPGTIWYCQIFREVTEEDMDRLGREWTFMGEYEMDQYAFRLYRIE